MTSAHSRRELAAAQKPGWHPSLMQDAFAARHVRCMEMLKTTHKGRPMSVAVALSCTFNEVIRHMRAAGFDVDEYKGAEYHEFVPWNRAGERAKI